jgi:hypothetical protein
VRARKARVWGESSPEVAFRAERLAMEQVLPKLGFTELYHASLVNRFVPFDVVATYNRRRVLVDVTTAISKCVSLKRQQSLAEALRMPLYVLFVKPDLTRYQLRSCDGSRSIQAHLAELATVE